MKTLGHSKIQLMHSYYHSLFWSLSFSEPAPRGLRHRSMTRHYPLSSSRILTLDIQFTAIGGFAVGYLELITLNMCPLYCKPEDIGLASGFLGSAKQAMGTIASRLSTFHLSSYCFLEQV